MRLSANRIRSINLRISQAEASAFSDSGRGARRLPNVLKPSAAVSPMQVVRDVVLAKTVTA
ncbi:MAG TPA: hypothetical protein VFC37_01095 [Terracidiphilus sp.]|nr:hypothetical protein [Terracidiphilus sp.]